MSFRSSARNRLGSLSSFKSSAPPAAVQHDDSDDGEDNYDYDSEEEEERLLSRRHGEAQEDLREKRSSNNNNHENDKKRKPTDEEIAAEYNNKEKNQKKQRVARRARAINEMDLVQPNGLSTIFTTFPVLFRKQNYPTKSRKDMAKFSRQLILAYQQWSNAIVPTTPLEEVAWRIQTLNSKTTVKRFLQTMRDKVRNQHVERLYGLEKAEQMIAQLDMALSEQQDDTFDHNHDNGLDNHEGALPEDQDREPITAPALPEEDPSLSVPPNTGTNTTDSNNNTTKEDATAAEARNTITPTPAVRKPIRRHVLDDSSDEEELTFEDDDEEDDKDAPKTPKLAPPSMRRPVLQESDDEDDDRQRVPETKKTGPPVPGMEAENPRKDDSVTIHNEQGSETDGLAENRNNDDTPIATKASSESPVEDEETNPGIVQHANSKDDDDDDDDDEAEFEFDTQPAHLKIPTTTVPPISETLDESATGLDVNNETTPVVESHEVNDESGIDHTD